MNAVDYIKTEMGMSIGWITGLMSDMKDAPLKSPTPNGGNHPLWNVGHLAYSEANLLHVYIKGEANPLSEWEEKFGAGTQPVTDASQYPSFEEVLAKYESVRAATLAYIDSLSDADLDKPSHAPTEMKDFFGTVGQCLAAMTVHLAFHGGQIADARRADGRAPLMA